MFGSSIFSLENLTRMQMMLPGILLGFVLHEFAHALVADKLGDPTPRSQGRITLDPRAHIDLLGLILILFIGFGWAKPVTTNPRNFKNYKRDNVLVSIAGPIANILLAALFIFILRIFNVTDAFSSNEQLSNTIASILLYSAQINVVLFALNLIPLPGFDGYHVITILFNTWKYRIFTILEQYGTIIFLLLVVTSVLGRIINPIVSFIFNILLLILL